MRLTGLTPNLICEDIARSTAFYRDVLGFTITRTVPDEAPFVFVWLEHDGVSVFLNDLTAVRLEAPSEMPVDVGKSGVMMFLAVEGVNDFWDAIGGKARVVMPIRDQWYGMREFSIVDPDGYVITLAERISE